MTKAKAKDKLGSPGASPYVLALRDELRSGSLEVLADFGLGDLGVEVARGRDSIWALIRRPGRGGLALRAAYGPSGEFTCRKVPSGHDEVLRLQVESSIGKHTVCFTTSETDLHRLRVVTHFVPAVPLLVPFLPRDLYPLGTRDDPLEASGNVEASQRGVNAGLLYFLLDEPAFGSVLYFQNLTAMNPYFQATGTTPDGVVGGAWPELGYLPPTPTQRGTPPARPLAVGEEIVLSDAIIAFRDNAADTEEEMARQFLQMLGIAYKTITLPQAEYRDWTWRAERTLADLGSAKEATVRQYGKRYVMPYVEGEVPDAMVQMSVIAALHDYGKWLGEPIPLEAEFMAGMGKFYDPEIKTLRRFLPNVGKDEKDTDAVDSWYLYHPMLNLGRLALDGNRQARALLLKSVDYGIRAARHFDYAWPVMYRIQDFSVMEPSRGDERFGQTDVGGIYAYLMLQCFDLTGEQRFLDEARAAIDKAKGLRFDLMYQANLTTWGAVACMRLWRITDDPSYLAQSYVYVASFLHNCEIWESQLGHAVHYSNFLGVTCLHDAPYMALYECFESYAGFEEFLHLSGPDLDPAARMLVSEYCKYGVDRAWFYFPDVLPPEMLHDGDHQSGVIKRELSFPLEDLYGDGQPAGKVGQEIYGCGAAFVYATRSHHNVENAPFRLFCNLFVHAIERTADKALSIQLDGGETCTATLSLVRLKGRRLPQAKLMTASGDALRPRKDDKDRVDFRVPAKGRLILTWN